MLHAARDLLLKQRTMLATRSGGIATVIEHCEGPSEPRPGHPPAETVRVLATLRRFGREGTPWRSLKATPTEASGSTLRRRLADWAAINLLQRVHAVLVAMLRGDPTLIVDSCSVRAKRGGDLVGPNPTDRGKRGTKYHVAVTGDGVPVACAATAANVNDTVLFERLFLMAFAVVARIGTVFADKGYDAEGNREPAGPSAPSLSSTSGAGRAARAWASGAGRSSAATPGCSRTDAWRCATTARASSSSPCSRPPVSSWLQDASPGEL